MIRRQWKVPSIFNVLYGSQFKFDKEAMPAEIDALTEKIMKEYEEGEKPERRKRILLTGCPSSGAPMKVVKQLKKMVEMSLYMRTVAVRSQWIA